MAFVLTFSFVRVPEIGYAIYVILKRTVSDVLGTAGNPTRTTSHYPVYG